MEAGGGAPPAEAMRGGRGVSAVIAIVIAVVTFLAGVGVGFFAFSPAPTTVDFLIVGTNTPFPPWVQRNNTTTFIEGFDVDLITEVLDRSGWPEDRWDLVDYRTFQPLLTALAKGQVHVMIGGITSNLDVGADRNRTMDFTDWYYHADQGVLVRSAETRDICPNANDCSFETDINKTAYAGRVGTQELTTSFYFADALTNIKPLVTKGSVTDLILALDRGEIDIAIIDRPAADGIVAQQPGRFKVEGTIQTNELYAFAVNNNDPLGLIPRFNAALDDIKADGTFLEIHLEWFGVPPPA